MTREEAIRCLSVHSSTNGSGLCTDKQHYEAKQMAIKALSQQTEDAISRQAAIDEIRYGKSYITKISPTGNSERLYESENNALEEAVERIEKLPSVIPSRPTGHWIARETWLDFIREECSLCGKVYSRGKDVVFNYCPCCGAYMVESEEQE